VRLSDFDFELPGELIAQHPAQPRDSARLLEVGDRLADRAMRDLPRLLRPGDILVYNDTRVIKARLNGRRGAVAVEATLHQRLDDTTWRAFARPGKRLRVGDVVEFAPGFAAEVRDKGEGGEITLGFRMAAGTLLDALKAHGQMPLPPYIKRGVRGETRDEADYQTLWGVREGAVAASTAGLHFTPDLLRALDDVGIQRAAVTLHVGAGTFLPVKTETVEEHLMHAEWGELSAETAERLIAARAAGGRIVAVGTTVLRVLETVSRDLGRLAAWQGETRLFVLPGFRFRAVDLLLTNFHLPKSTLFMLVAAFSGLERMKAAYAHAIGERYRFFSYGDACLLHPASA
jgi:S-adenosylmethionine:tRNA ribosyltransferase-isomerase